MQLRCYPHVPDSGPDLHWLLGDSLEDPLVKIQQAWLLFSVQARLPIFFAGIAGLFICFWPGKRPVRRILLFVCLPALTGLVALCGRYLYLARGLSFPYTSVLQQGPHNQAWGFGTVWALGPAVHMSVLGIVLVLLFLSRLAMGIASLPLTVAGLEQAATDPDGRWKWIKAFIFIGLVGLPLIGIVADTVVRSLYGLLLRFVNFHWLPPTSPIELAMNTAVLALVLAWAVGQDRWRELQILTRPAQIQFAMLGIATPIAIHMIPNLIAYLSDRIHWAAFEYGKFSSPAFSTYFQFPHAFFFWYLLAAAFEEIVVRGYLQPRFLKRYGMIRGILLLGMAWGAFHFLGDFQGATEDYQVLLKLVSRLSLCIAMSYVLGWMTLRSRSIWPAVFAHGLHNVWGMSWVDSGGAQNAVFSKALVLTCWGLLGFLLFRFWPPENSTVDSEQSAQLHGESQA
jgi:membrane protease YdiL (CAAX protease family)